MAAESTFYHGATLADKLRLSAAEGNANKVVDYLNKGADFQPDRVSDNQIWLIIIIGLHVSAIYSIYILSPAQQVALH